MGVSRGRNGFLTITRLTRGYLSNPGSGRPMAWQAHCRNFVSALRPALAPIVLGVVTGGLALGAAVHFGKPDSPAPAVPHRVSETETAAPARAAAARSERPVRRTYAAAPATGRWLLDVYQKPNQEAVDLTHRLENGLPIPVPRKIAATRPPPALRRAFGTGAGKPVIAIIIDDMGYDHANSARAVALPPEVTLSYMPFAPEVARQVAVAKRRGHEIMLHLPMEAIEQHGHPGPDMLAVADRPRVLSRQLSRMLDAFTGYVGVNNHEGSRFTQDRPGMTEVLRELRRRGLFFVDSRTTGRTVGPAVARAVGIPYAARDVFLDHDPAPDDIRARMEDTERVARQTGRAIAIGHPRSGTMALIAPWLESIEARGFRLVPVSALLSYPERPKIVAQTTPAE